MSFLCEGSNRKKENNQRPNNRSKITAREQQQTGATTLQKRSANRKPREQVAYAIESQREQHKHATLKAAQQTKLPAGSSRIVAKEKEFFPLLSDRNNKKKQTSINSKNANN